MPASYDTTPQSGPATMNAINNNHTSSQIYVRIDHRESQSAAALALQAMDDLAIEFERLPVGDYQIGETFIFERKTLSDLAVSIQDGRLFRQARALAALPASTRGVFLLEGTSAGLKNSEMRRESIQGALITVSLFFGIPVLRSMDGEESARLMVYAARQSKWFKTAALPRHGKRPKGKRKAQLALLQGLPGIGPDRARRLLDHFGSVEAVLTAATEDLASIQGIGQGTARGIRWVVSEGDAPGYG